MPIIQVKGLQVIAIYVSDLERSKVFYEEKFGFKPGEEMSPGLLMNAGNITIYLEGGREFVEKPMLRYPEVSVCLDTDSIKNAYSKLKEDRVQIITEYVEYAPSFGMFRIADPDGNVFEFAGQP